MVDTHFLPLPSPSPYFMLSEFCSHFEANELWTESKHDKHQAQILL